MITVPAFSLAQIPKGANTIIVKNVSLIQVSNALLDQGYAIEKIDSNLNTIKTERLTLKNGSHLTAYIRIKDSDAIMYGMGNFSGDSFAGLHFDDMRISYGAAKNTFMTLGFDKLNSFALTFNKPVEYKIE